MHVPASRNLLSKTHFSASRSLREPNTRLLHKSTASSASVATTTIAKRNETVTEELRTSIQEAMNTEIEAAVVRGIEAEMGLMQETVAEAVANSLDTSVRFDLRANFNTLVALTGVVIFERGVWSAWDSFFGDSFSSNIASIGVGLAIMVSVPLFKIPLAEWRRPGLD